MVIMQRGKKILKVFNVMAKELFIEIKPYQILSILSKIKNNSDESSH